MTKILTSRPTTADLDVVPCDYCRAVLREVLAHMGAGVPLLPGAYAFLNGQLRILAHVAAGHPSDGD